MWQQQNAYTDVGQKLQFHCHVKLQNRGKCDFSDFEHGMCQMARVQKLNSSFYILQSLESTRNKQVWAKTSLPPLHRQGMGLLNWFCLGFFKTCCQLKVFNRTTVITNKTIWSNVAQPRMGFFLSLVTLKVFSLVLSKLFVYVKLSRDNVHC